MFWNKSLEHKIANCMQDIIKINNILTKNADEYIKYSIESLNKSINMVDMQLDKAKECISLNEQLSKDPESSDNIKEIEYMINTLNECLIKGMRQKLELELNLKEVMQKLNERKNKKE